MSSEHIAEEFKDEEGNPIGGGGGELAELIIKSVDESVVASDVLQDDDELFFPVVAGEKWYMNATLYYLGAPGFKYSFVVDSGTPDVAFISEESIEGDFDRQLIANAFGVELLAGGAAVARVIRSVITLDNTGGDATTFRLRWAQQIAVGTTVLGKGSTLIAWKL